MSSEGLGVKMKEDGTFSLTSLINICYNIIIKMDINSPFLKASCFN
jgi:hypothetical protein